MGRDYNVPDEFRDNFISHLKQTMDDDFDNHIKHTVDILKQKEVRDTVKAVSLIKKLYEFKVRYKKWIFHLRDYLISVDFPVSDKKKLDQKTEEFARVLVNESWDRVCRYHKKKDKK